MFFAPLAMREILSTLGPRTREALGALLPGPVTAVVANPEHRYPLACREDPERLGLRLVEGPLAGARHAIFQTSANRSGEPAPSRFEDVDAEILAGVDVAIDGGEVGGKPSTVVDLTPVDDEGTWELLREGALSREELEVRLREAFGNPGTS
jgi:L-threonylcarbamoyladenylate synthase